LPPDHRSDEAAAATASFHADVVRDVEAAIAKDPVVVVGMAQNPVVKKVRRALDEAGIPFTYLEYGSYFSEWKRRLAIKMWSGWPTFPQVYVHGVLVGGNAETRAALADGMLQKRIERAR
jgi:glutaredoxin-related protein